ncbi:MAG: hypothetical protein V1790_08375 [Planctomycetota bacterium]
MADVHRRVVPKPADATPDRLDLLRGGLQEAVRLQSELAGKSLHVLQLCGDLQEDETCFFVEHEPAEAVEAGPLFDPQGPRADELHLLTAAVGLTDALRAAHARDAPKQAVHGGICPGVVLTDSAGTMKLTDFSFARVICETLGVKSYIELAVGPADIPSSTHRTTGCWQVLREDDHTRDDRLCAFVDPYKYGTSALATFERASDIIALGIFLHLLAEHRHPLLGGGDEHRLVATSESMAYFPYAGARRKDLRESTNPSVRRWCELVAQMLSSEPQNRPGVQRIFDALAEVGVRPLDSTERFARRLSEARELAEMGRWEEVNDKVAPLLADPNVPPPIAEQVKQLAERTRLQLLIREGERIASTDDWRNARKLIDQLPKTGLPPDETQAREKVLDRLRGLRRLEDELNAVETVSADLTVSDADTSLNLVTGLLGRLEQVADESTVPSQRQRRDQLLQTLIRRRGDLTSAKQRIDAEREAVRAWFATAKKAWEAEDWAAFEACRQGRPTTPHWPNDVRKSFEKLEEHHRVVQTAVAWIAHVPQTLPEDVTLLEQLLAERPELHGNPAGLSRDVEQVAARVRGHLARATDFRRAREWITGVSQAMNAADWPEAKQRLLRRPALADWPAEVLEEADRLGVEIDLQLRQQELVRIVVGSWLESAQSAADRGDLERAIAILSEPPSNAKPLAQDTLREVDKRVEDYKRGLRDRIARRDEIAKAEVETVVRDLLVHQFRDLIDPGRVEVRLDSIAWDAKTLESNGKARVHVALPSRVVPAGKTPHTHAVELRSAAARVIVVNAEPFGTDLASTLIESIKQAQQTRIADVVRPLQDGLFPQARADAPIDRPVPRTTAAIRLLGNDVPAETLDVELAWDPRGLQWTILRPEDFHRRLRDFVVARAQPHVKPLLLKRSPLLARHESALFVEVALPPGQRFDAASRLLRLEGRVDIALNEEAGHRASATFPVSCPAAGKVVVDADPGPIEAKLLAVIAAAQESARTALERTLRADVQALPAKAKVAVHRSIKRPVEAVVFSLRPKHGEIRELSAAWNDKTLQFDPPDNWPALLKTLATLAPQPPPARPRRRASIGLAGTAAVALAAGIWAFWPSTHNGGGGGSESRNGNKKDNSNENSKENSNENGNENRAEEPPPPWDKICDSRRDEVVNLLRKADLPGNANFDQHADSLVTCEPSAPTPLLCYTIPGLCEKTDRAPKTTADNAEVPCYPRCVPVNDSFVSNLPGNFQNLVDGDVKKLRELLDTASDELANVLKSVEESVGEHLDKGLVDPQQVTVAWQPGDDAVWKLDETRTFWRTRAFTFQVRVKTDGDPLEPLSDAQPIRFVASNGSLNREPEELTELAAGLADAVSSYVGQLRDREQGKLEQTLSARRGDGWEITKAANFTKTHPAWTLTHPRLLERRLQASWNVSKLSFDADEWNNAVDEIVRLTQRLDMIDRQIAAPDHWMRKPWNGEDVPLLQEARTPKNGTWPLMLPAPWAPNASQKLEMLYLDATIEGDQPKFEPPFYWPVLERYTGLTRTPQPLSGKDAQTIDSAKLAAGDKKLLQDLLSLKLFGPQLTLDTAPSVEWSCNPDPPQNASLAVAAKINLGRRPDSPVPPEVDKAALDELLVEVAPAYPCRVEFNHDPEQAADPKQKIQIVQSPPGGADFSALKEFDKALGELPARIKAEGDLAGILRPNETERLSDPDFRSALNAIWNAKGGSLPVPRGDDVRELVHGIRTNADDQVRSKFKGGKPDETLRNLHANAFVEYFTGPNDTYALAWSTGAKEKTTAFLKGPVLLRPADAEQVHVFFRRILETVRPDSTDAKELGIVIGVDERLDSAFTDQKFAPLSLSLASDATGEASTESVDSLAAVRNLRERLANYILVPTLPSLATVRARAEEEKWRDPNAITRRRQTIEWLDQVRVSRP